MNTFVITDYVAAVPEMFMAVMVMITLLVGVFSPEGQAARNANAFTKLSLVGALLLVVMRWPDGMVQAAFPRTGESHALSAMFVVDNFAATMKILLLGAGLVAVTVCGDYLRRSKLHKPEFYTLILLCITGMMLMISAFDLLVVYVGMEMMSFALYIMAAYNRDCPKSAEAGLKYFVLGSLASGILLYGMSLLYGVAGGTSFITLENALRHVMTDAAGHVTLSVALVMMLTGFAFKISAVPFHMWTPDVYEGSPTPVTAFMAVLPKIAAFAMLMRMLVGPFGPMFAEWSQVIIALSVLTMAVGALLAILQDNIKRLLAYSSIGHVGFMLVGLASGTVTSVQSVSLYLVMYAVMTLGAFTVLLSLQNRGVYAEKITDLAGLSKTAPGYAFAMMIFMFSLAGIPPFAGFFAKFYVFREAVNGDLVWLAVTGAIFSVIAAYYCLRVIKAMYLDEGGIKVDTSIAFPLRAMITLLAIATVGLGLFPQRIAEATQVAASSLF